MTDDRFDDFVQDAAARYNEPPETPREEIWTRIEAARRQRTTRTLDLMPRRRRWLVLGAPLGLAAALLVGVAIGRVSRSSGPETGSPTAVAASPTHAAPLAVQLAAAEHLTRVDALLVEYGSGQDAADVAGLAHDLLSRTRLWIDADRITDPRLRSLLEDLELVLVQIVQLAPSATAEERSIVDRGISELEIRNRLRNAIPAGPTA